MLSCRPTPALLGALAIATTACGASADPPEPERAAAAEHVATYEPVGEGGDMALFDGVLRVDGGCVVLLASDGQRFLPRFPADEVGWADGVLRYQDRTYRDGDRISLGGGYSGVDLGALPAVCRDVQVDEQLTVAQR